MQKEIQLTDKTLLVVSVPKEASDLTLPKVGMADLYFRTDDKEHEDSYISVGIPQGYKLLGIYPELTEEQAISLVENTKSGHFYFNKFVEWDVYKNYLEIGQEWFDTSLESFQSLMERENITGYDKYAILIKSK